MKYIELSTLRILAVLLIVNSHLHLFYEYKYLATGGAIGNAIFFFISGIGLSYSLAKNKINYFTWVKKRYLRIYPKLIIIVLFYILIGFIVVENTTDLFVTLIFPEEFWFLPVLTYFYLIIYFIITNLKVKEIKKTLFAIFIIYLISYYLLIDNQRYSIEENILLKSIFYLFVMVLGVLVFKIYDKLYLGIKYSSFILFISISCFYLLKFTMLKYDYYFIQFLEHFFILIILYSLLTFLKTKQIILFQKNRIINIIIMFVSSISLEIYLTHNYFKEYPFSFFPLNILIFIPCVLISAYLLKKIFSFFEKKIKNYKSF